ncbi:MAG TPA: acyltransferase family protein [Jiangellales bacterium]|nr:acyltransferase family protein [Jiangellales bacterium]
MFLDALRAALVVMVIVHHASQPYGPAAEGNWPVADAASSDWFVPFWTVNAAVGLGLLFLLAGYVTALACDHKGERRFAADRWRRIGIPLVVIVLAVNLPMVYLVMSRPPLGEFVGSLYEDGWRPIYMHLWFLAHLLLYTAAYLGWRWVRARRGGQPRRWRVPGHRAIAGYVVALSLLTWVIRWEYPVDTWVPLLVLLPAEPAKMAQYVSLFALGVLAWRGDWLRRLPRRVGYPWLAVGLTAAASVYLLQAVAPERWTSVMTLGGVNGGSLLRSTWEALICAGLAAGLVVLFRDVVRRSGPLLAAVAAASYAAYIVHVYLLVAVQAAVAGLPVSAFTKFAVVSIVGVALCFAVGHLSRYVPGLRVVLGTSAVRTPAGRPSVPTSDDVASTGHLLARRL